MAATSTLLELIDAGSHVVAMDDLYGGTFRLFERVRRRSANIDFTFADLSDAAVLPRVVRPDTKMIWIETPTNPTLRLADIAQITEFARKRGILTVVDNTFASPWVQRPLDARRRHRDAFGDQVPQRPLRHDRRRRRRA